jgi:hypothetical protein
MESVIQMRIIRRSAQSGDIPDKGKQIDKQALKAARQKTCRAAFGAVRAVYRRNLALVYCGRICYHQDYALQATSARR